MIKLQNIIIPLKQHKIKNKRNPNLLKNHHQKLFKTYKNKFYYNKRIWIKNKKSNKIINKMKNQ
jgi:hypothetical protein